QRCLIGPLQVVEEDHQRMLGLGEHTHKLQQQLVEAVARLGGAELQRRRLRPDDQLDIGDDVDQHLAVAIKGLLKALFPNYESLRAFAEQLADQIVERLNNRRIGDAAVELIELTCDHIAALSS